MITFVPVLLLASVAAAFATPSGLNNIPTADTTPMGTFVLQGFTTLGGNRDADFNLGFKTGIDLKAVKLELGLASHLVPGKGGPVEPHIKLAVPLGEGLPQIAVGAANNSFRDEDRRRAGDTFAYFVVSQDFHWFRAHAGLAVQDSQPQPFFGFDKTFRLEKKRVVSDGKSTRVTTTGGAGAGTGHGAGAGDPYAALVTRDLFTLRTDAIQMRNHDWLLSAGALIPVTKWLIFEAWGNFPTDGGQASATLKANFVFSF